ncbi:MAG: carbohydrate ABC transporter substrate-binding protein, partial [Clostridiales bacterium]|nr:carbohydrate ABC transporter substrate-binding protein [Clostridiales bacterium]
YGSALLGGQNHIALFADTAPHIDMSNIGSYDQGLNESFQGAMSVYFTGEIGLDEALRNFREDALRKYPELDMSGIG